MTLLNVRTILSPCFNVVIFFSPKNNLSSRPAHVSKACVFFLSAREALPWGTLMALMVNDDVLLEKNK